MNDDMQLIPIDGNKNYMCDKYGKIYSLNYGRTNKLGVLKPSVVGDGYHSVFLFKNRYLVHRIIALTFIPNPDNKPTVNHKDGNKLNNKVDNLEWCTYSENHKHAYNSLGRQNPFKKLSGKNSKYSTPVIQKKENGEVVKEWGSINEANRNGFNSSCICKCLKTGKKHKGYIWEKIK